MWSLKHLMKFTNTSQEIAVESVNSRQQKRKNSVDVFTATDIDVNIVETQTVRFVRLKSFSKISFLENIKQSLPRLLTSICIRTSLRSHVTLHLSDQSKARFTMEGIVINVYSVFSLWRMFNLNAKRKQPANKQNFTLWKIEKKLVG